MDVENHHGRDSNTHDFPRLEDARFSSPAESDVISSDDLRLDQFSITSPLEEYPINVRLAEDPQPATIGLTEIITTIIATELGSSVVPVSKNSGGHPVPTYNPFINPGEDPYYQLKPIIKKLRRLLSDAGLHAEAKALACSKTVNNTFRYHNHGNERVWSWDHTAISEKHEKAGRDFEKLERFLEKAVEQAIKNERQPQASNLKQALESIRESPLLLPEQESQKKSKKSLWNRVKSAAKNTIEVLKKIPKVTTEITKLVFSKEHRTRRLGEYFESRIRRWEKEDRLTPDQALLLRTQAEELKHSPHWSGLAAHQALIPAGYIGTFGVLPAMATAGWVSPPLAVVATQFIGIGLRTAYTLGRIVSTKRGERRPWLALGIGALPYVGQAAYAFQMIADNKDQKELGIFLAADLNAQVGKAIPIFGGKNSKLEHLMSRYPMKWLLPIIDNQGATRIKPRMLQEFKL